MVVICSSRYSLFLDNIYYIFKKDYSKILDIGFRDSVSREVAEAIIDLGVNAGSYVKYFEHKFKHY